MWELNYKYSDIKKKLLKLWFVLKRQAKWSHQIWIKDKNIIILPNHWNKNISKWVIKSIINKLWITNKEFKDL